MTLHLPAETFRPAEPAALTPSRRGDGWSAANQRAFLEAIAEGHGVDAAAARVGLSVTSAYAFRRTAKGAAFALGWRAASLLARETLAETLLVRALEGQIDTIVRADGSTYTRHRHDNRLAAGLLARLDRQVESAPDADIKAARLVAQDFDAFLNVVERDEGPARAGLFLAGRSRALAGGTADVHDLAPIYALAAADRLVRTGVATAGEIDTSDLDPRDRAGWTAEQWARAEAAGLLALAPEKSAPAPQHSQHSHLLDGLLEPDLDPADDPDQPVWYDCDEREWRTSFPPPADFAGEEDGRFGEGGYSRTLSADEEAAVERWDAEDTAEARATGAAARDAFFAGGVVGDEAEPLTPSVTPDVFRGPTGHEPDDGDLPENGASPPIVTLNLIQGPSCHESDARRGKAASSDGA